MDTFKDLYVRAYDVMYADKAYDAETAYVLRALREGNIGSGRMLSLGAGTLNYELRLAREGFSIIGIDVSEAMVALGKAKLQHEGALPVSLSVGDMRLLPNYSEPFDVALALFNVISYCRTPEELELVFGGVARNLREGGLFVLDCWNGEAVRRSPPVDREKIFPLGTHRLVRTTKVISASDAMFELSITLQELDGEHILAEGTEIHQVRGWDRRELSAIAVKTGFVLRHESVFPDWILPPDAAHWALGAVFEKIS